MKTTSFAILLFGVVLYGSFTQGEIPTRFRRLYNDQIIKGRKNTFGVKVGIPLVFNAAKKSLMETRISGTDTAAKEVDQEMTDDESSRAMGEELTPGESGPGVAAKFNQDSKDEDDEEDDDNDEKEGSQHDKAASTPRKEDEMGGEKEISQSSGEFPDLSGEFPPSADQVSKLPKDLEITPGEVDRKILDRHKGYFQFTIRQRFKPEYKYKESPAYKILAGNVVHDVEKALKTTKVVKEVLFREVKNVGGPPYRSKVQVYMKTIKVNPKRMKKIIDYGLINGMITVPGSFHTT